MEKRCEECGRPPRRLSMEMEGLLFCQRACYLTYSGRKWDRQFTETFNVKPKAQLLELRKSIRSA